MLPRSSAARSAWLVFAATLPVYLVTMNRTIGFIDRGELAAVAWTFGIPHATGYPTLMLVAGVLSHLVPLRPVLVLNGLAALLTAAGVACLALLMDWVLAAAARAPIAPRVRVALTSLATLFVAFTLTWWQQANGFEVYALHALFMPLVVWLFLRWSDAVRIDAAGPISPVTRRAGFVFALVTGLSLTNHMTTLLLVPGLLLFAFVRLQPLRRLTPQLLAMVPPFLLGLLPYLWLPLRSRMSPRFNWGDPETPAALFRHVTGADYHGFMFRDATALVDQLRYLQWRLPSDFAWIGLVIAAIGCGWWLRRAPALAALALSFVIAGIVFAAGYRIPDPDAYLMTAVLGLALLCGAGLLRVLERFGVRVALALATLLVVANVTLHWRESDERDNQLVEHFVVDLLGPLPENAVLFTAGWEIGESASLYFQEVEGYRRDVMTVSVNLLRARWYLDEIERRAPDLVGRAGLSFTRYRDLLRDVELGKRHPVEVLARARAEFLDVFATECARDRPVFSMTSLTEVRPEWDRVPWHLAQWLRPGKGYVAEAPWLYAFEPWSNRADLYTAQAHWAYGEARFRRAQYEVRHGRTVEGRAVLARASRFDPGFRPEQVAPLPLGYDRTVLESVRFFRGLGEAVIPTASR